MIYKAETLGLSAGIMCISIASVFCAPLSLDSRVRVAPKFMSHTGYAGTGYFNSVLDLELDGSSWLDENSTLDFAVGSAHENQFSLARRNYLALKFSQNMSKILEKDAAYSVEYRNTDFKDSLDELRGFGESSFNFKGRYNFSEQLSGTLGYGIFDKSASFDDDSYKFNNLALGCNLWVNNRKDVFDISYGGSKKDASNPNRGFRNSRNSFSYRHLFDNFDSMDAGIETSSLRYAKSAEEYSYDETKLMLGYSDYFPDGLRDISVSYRNRIYTGKANPDLSEVVFGHSINYAETQGSGEKMSRHMLRSFNVKSGADNDYFGWDWSFLKFTKSLGQRGFYFSNDFSSKFWRNFEGSAKNESFFEDIIGTGVRWRSHKFGSFTMGPVAGWRVFNDPDSRINSFDDDNKMLDNPGNFYLYGFRSYGSCYPIENVEINLNLDYKSFRDYNARNGKSKNELFLVDFVLNYKIMDNLKLVGNIEHRMNLDKASHTAAGAHMFNCGLHIEYLFKTIFTGAVDEKNSDI